MGSTHHPQTNHYREAEPTSLRTSDSTKRTYERGTDLRICQSNLYNYPLPSRIPIGPTSPYPVPSPLRGYLNQSREPRGLLTPSLDGIMSDMAPQPA